MAKRKIIRRKVTSADAYNMLNRIGKGIETLHKKLDDLVSEEVEEEEEEEEEKPKKKAKEVETEEEEEEEEEKESPFLW